MGDLGEMTFLPRFEGPLLSGEKWMTIRRGPHGHKGDTFHAFGFEFALLYEPAPFPLSRVITLHYREMGAVSPNEALRNLFDAYPSEVWTGERIVWLHAFRRTGKPAPAPPPPPHASTGHPAIAVPTVEPPPPGG
jgi:hypothetical protein